MYHAIIGICPTQTSASRDKITVTFLLYVLGFTLSVIFLCHEASTFLEYSNNMYVTSGLTMTIAIYAISVSKIPELFEYFSDWEKLVNQSGSQIYCLCKIKKMKLNQKELVISQDLRHCVCSKSTKRLLDKLNNCVELDTL